MSYYDHILRPSDQIEDVACYIWWNPVRKNFLSPVANHRLDHTFLRGPILVRSLENSRRVTGLKTGHYTELVRAVAKQLNPGLYRFAPKASRRPSQSFTTNSRQCQGMLPSPRVNSTPWAAYSACSASASSTKR